MPRPLAETVTLRRQEVLYWIAAQLLDTTRSDFIPWVRIQRQLGNLYGRQFKESFARDFAVILAHQPRLAARIVRGGLSLSGKPPPGPAVRAADRSVRFD